jgi:hypothetical protein
MFELTPYRNPYAVSLANLVGGADRARAAAIQQSGQAIAQGAQQVGQDINATANNLVRLKLDEPRRQMEGIELARAQRAEQDEKDAKQAFQDAQGDPSKALTLLETKGNYQVAMKLRGQLNQQRIQDLDLMGKTLDETHKRLEQASQLVQGVMSSQDPASAWPTVAPRVRALVGEQLAAHVPDDYSPDFANQALAWGTKVSDTIRMRRDAAQGALAGLRSAVTKTDLTNKLTDATAKWAQTVESQDDWDNARKQIKLLGGDTADGVLSRFPAEYSDALKGTALKIQQAGQTVKFQHETVQYTGADGKVHIGEANYDAAKGMWFAPGSDTPLTNVQKFERDRVGEIDRGGLVKTVLDHPEAYNDLTDTAKTAIWPALNAAGFKPPAAKDRGASPATAERWRMNQLERLDREYRAQRGMPEGVPGYISPEEYERQKSAIEASYRAQLGSAASPTTQTPQTLLSDKHPGKYTLTDGSIWIKDRDGSIRNVAPATKKP